MRRTRYAAAVITGPVGTNSFRIGSIFRFSPARE